MSIDKKAFRAQMRKLRNSIPEDLRVEKDLLIANALRESPVYQKAGVIYSYASYNSEAATGLIHEMIKKDGKVLALPKVVSETEMIFYKIGSDDCMMSGYMGIPEPDTSICQAVIPKRSDEALMLMPGLAFDEAHYRMGYGGGFYDRYLAKYGNDLTCAMIAYEEQKVSEVPHDSHDQKPDLIITDKGIYQ